MRVSHQTVAAILATTVASSAINIQIQIPGPEVEAISTRPVFALMALRSATPIHLSPISAFKSALSLLVPNQHAICIPSPPPSPNHAVFVLEDRELFLYTEEGNFPRQQVYVDLEGRESTGLVSFTPAIHGPPSRPIIPDGGVLEGWEIVDQYLIFRGQYLVACPTFPIDYENENEDRTGNENAGWKIFVAEGGDGRGRKEGEGGCLAFSARILPVPEGDAVACTYN
ncbi:hypothetical protein ONS95_005217 [Cadophora gregata]|uniref:uncharacterized protein n=1 Tax=Cadophora gregata TaxID=51156 RepID=UPI0026DBAEA9|nr:uncharacterized protein ONS95_005217 [Cadophora gregata]KAK0104956.1 hypothetical protein ONS95_005217 [Cadophora gregata]